MNEGINKLTIQTSEHHRRDRGTKEQNADKRGTVQTLCKRIRCGEKGFRPAQMYDDEIIANLPEHIYSDSMMIVRSLCKRIRCGEMFFFAHVCKPYN